ncbi:hypothetical protein GM661_12220 [Iocasia frigidifontis]|uniref:Lipoprotein n=1 Tax=Iocasia fonsfrigidae TaxID=2682810 RepID=A0A8A7KKS0_9FIRM|nr:hypothetical protein [Iocasia fonsfrigidae]QTL98674.1 hypothetical protein GM661_12220 [Iocasia fonsfrigidae]
MEKKLKKIVLLLLTPLLIFSLTACKIGSHNEEAVRAKIKDYLYQKYGEEFIVDRIGTRNDDGITEYVARIYPKSIIGTNKEGDSYYYGSASVDKLSFGRLDEPGDSYSYVKMNLTGEKYLMPKVKEIFGDRVLLKVDSELKVWGRDDLIVKEYRKRDKNSNGVDAFLGYKESDFRVARKRVINDPKNNRLEIELYIYIFDRIDNEKEERRKQIFDFVQYLKQEGLFKYLELGVIFIDERVLATGYREYRQKINCSERVKEVIDGETVKLPPIELRKEMSEVLQREVDGMSEEELLASMGKIRKSELKDLIKYNMHSIALVYSLGILEEKYPSSITEEDKKNKYDVLDNIILERPYNYMYINN